MFKVLGVRFNAVQIPSVIQRMEKWIARRDKTHYISVSNVHSVVESRRNTDFKHALNVSDLNVPDGMPIIWIGRLKNYKLARRVYGPDLLMDFLRATQGRNRHFFYGGAPAVVQDLVSSLKEKFPGLQIAGFYSPPFRSLTSQEDAQVIDMINDAHPDVLWVGLGCPKQELWMHSHRALLKVPAIVGVGQAFNIFAGSLKQAPRWMREHGLEWLFRLCLEPRRLWRRYLVYNTVFLVAVLLDAIGIKNAD